MMSTAAFGCSRVISQLQVELRTASESASWRLRVASSTTATSAPNPVRASVTPAGMTVPLAVVPQRLDGCRLGRDASPGDGPARVEQEALSPAAVLLSELGRI